MNIKLQNELIMTSFKTIDGRGFNVHISGGAGLTLQYISNVILHGVHIHDLKATGPAVIRSNVTHVGHRKGSDGDAVNIFGSRDIWVDHCYFARGPDGLVDAVMGSTAVTVSNNYFEQHDKVLMKIIILCLEVHDQLNAWVELNTLPSQGLIVNHWI